MSGKNDEKRERMDTRELSCVDCGIKACRGMGGEYPEFCLTKELAPELREKSAELLTAPENYSLTVAAAKTEADGYCKRSRVEEVLHLCRLMKIRRVGVATCVGFLNESHALARILRAHGYEVVGVACKCGAVTKNELGMPEECNSTGPNACNPILQALVLNREKTELNVAMGLCVGHDSLFYRYSDAFVTTLASKDRVTGHNPVAPLYQLDGYWRKLLKEDEFMDRAPETF